MIVFFQSRRGGGGGRFPGSPSGRGGGPLFEFPSLRLSDRVSVDLSEEINFLSLALLMTSGQRIVLSVSRSAPHINLAAVYQAIVS